MSNQTTPDLETLFQTTAQLEFQKASAQLKNTKPFLQAVTKTYARHENLIATTADNSPIKPACDAGCSFCCHYKVEAQAHEVFLLKEFINTTFSAEKKQRVVSRLEANAAQISLLTPEQHLAANLPCALLENDQCSAYPARPFRCRNFHSTNAQACEDSFKNPSNLNITTEMIDAIAVVADAHTQGFEAAIQQAGRDAQIYDFTTALLEALQSDTPNKRYVKGKSAFQSAIKVED